MVIVVQVSLPPRSLAASWRSGVRTGRTSLMPPLQIFYAQRAYKISNRAKLLIPAVAIPM